MCLNHGPLLLVVISQLMHPDKSVFSIILFLAVALVNAQGPTYHSDIKPLIERHCISCHQEGEVGAMPLTNYEEVAAYGKMIEYVTSTRLMPPWYADPSYRHFKNERVLSEEEIKTIKDWVANDMKEGAMPYGLVKSKTAKVTVIPRPADLVIPMKESFEQFGVYMDQYQVFILKPNLDKDVWIEGIEFVPGNKKIVRHASISLAREGSFDSLDRWDPRYGYFSFGGVGLTTDQPFWYTWSPQQEATFYYNGTGKFLPKGSELIVHVHYGPTGKPLKDSSEIRLHIAQEKITHPVVTAPLLNPYNLTNDSLFVGPDTKKIFHSSYTLPYAIRLMSITPQANLINRTWEIFAKRPDSPEPVRLLKIKDWNINWKQTYHLQEPLELPAGTIINALALYDNTLDNLCNPSDKPIAIRPGAHLFNELFLVHFEFTTPDSTNALMQLDAPVTVSDSQLDVSFNSDKKTSYRIQLNEATSDKVLVDNVFKSVKGYNEYSIPISGLPFGNYIMTILDDKGKVVSRQMFVKIGKGGI